MMATHNATSAPGGISEEPHGKEDSVPKGPNKTNEGDDKDKHSSRFQVKALHGLLRFIVT